MNNKNLRKFLLYLETVAQHKFYVSIDGNFKRLTTGKNISKEKLFNSKIPENGYYTISEATCGGVCSIGKPHLKCIKHNQYVPGKCCVYCPIPIKDLSIKLGDIFKWTIDNDAENEADLFF